MLVMELEADPLHLTCIVAAAIDEIIDRDFGERRRLITRQPGEVEVRVADRLSAGRRATGQVPLQNKNKRGAVNPKLRSVCVESLFRLYIDGATTTLIDK